MHHRSGTCVLALAAFLCGSAPAQAQRTVPVSPLMLGTRIVTTGSAIRTQSRSARFRIVDTSTYYPILSSPTALSALAPSEALELRVPERGIDLRLERNAAGDITKVVVVPEPPPAPPRTPSESLSRTRFVAGVDTASLRRYQEDSRAQSVKYAVDLVLSILPLFEPPPQLGRVHAHTLDVVLANGDHPYAAHQRHVARRLADSLDASHTPIIRVRDSVSARVVTTATTLSAELRTASSSLDSLRGVRAGWRLSRSSDVLNQSYCWQSTMSGTSLQGAPQQHVHRVALTTRASACASWTSEARYRIDKRVADNERVRTMRGQQSVLVSRALTDAPGLRDSVLRAFATPQPDRERDRLLGALHAFSTPAPPFTTLQRLALRAGDSGWVVSHLARDPANRSAVVTAELWPVLARFLADDAYAFRRGVQRESLANSLLGSLLQHPPSLDAPSDEALCARAVCRLMAEQYRAGRDSPLSVVGLAAHVQLEPRVWYDSLAQYARRNPASGALPILLGHLSSRSPQSAHAMPALDADWHDWMRWRWQLGDDSSATRSLPVATRAALRVNIFNGYVGLLSARDVAVSLRWHAVRTGVDVASLLADRLRIAAIDSERVVFTSLLIELGAIRDSADRVATLLVTSDRTERFRGEAQLRRLDLEGGTLRTDSTGVAVQQRIVAGIIERFRRQRSYFDSTQRTQGLPPMRYAVSMSGLLPAMQQQLSAAGIDVIPARYREGEHESIARVTITVRQRGPLYFVDQTDSSRSFSPRGGYWMTADSGESYILISTPTGFRVINTQSWIA